MPDIYLPNIIKLELTNFSLYCEQSVVMDFSKPVSCLMGANGIGKSTLLNCVNFAITGRINPTNKKLKSIDTLNRGNNYYLQYFDGRISEVDKDYASTRIVFMLGNKRIEVVRNFFPDNSILEYKLDNETQDPRNYEDDVVRLANLNNYAQFVFLQLKVLTFDESRDCLFWNPSILTPTIFLCLLLFAILFLCFEVQIRCKLDQNRGMGPVERRWKPLKTLRKVELRAFHRVQTPERSVPLSPVTNP